MKFSIDKDMLFPNEERKHLRCPLGVRKAQKLANNLLREYKPYFPLAWDTLREVELIGEINASVEARLHFGTVESDLTPVVITMIYVRDDMEILQAGSSYGSFVY